MVTQNIQNRELYSKSKNSIIRTSINKIWLQVKKMSTENSDSQYIPNFIRDVPWYYKLNDKKTNDRDHQNPEKDRFAHQRKTTPKANIKHGLLSASTNGIDQSLNDYDAKRDRWQGYADEEWDSIVESWNTVKPGNADLCQEDSDETTYELELEELGLERKYLKSDNLENPLERATRDRANVPEYILGITSNEGGKLRYGRDSLASLVHQDSEFVRENKDEQDFKKIQAFAWEQNKKHEKELQIKLFYNEIRGEQNGDVTQANLDYVVEASPTLMMMKAREKERKAKEESDKRIKRLMERYGE